MPRYIDADALYEEVKKREETARQWVLDAPSSFNGNPNPAAIRYAAILGERTTMMHMIFDAPAADVAPVRHGRWLLVRNADETGNALYECSECHKGERHVPIVSVGYCWNCGAKMDGESDG